MNKNQKPHDGHRERLRNKVQKYGISSLEKHEVLEYLLTYVIPRRNTNDLGHALIDRFISVENVLNASVNELKSVKGIGSNAALFISSIGQLYSSIKTNSDYSIIIKNTRDCVTYFRSRYKVDEKECMYVLCFNAMGRLIHTQTFDGNCAELAINKQVFMGALINKEITSCIIIHTHPNGEAQPSQEDFEATKSLISICALLGVHLFDHIIFNEKDYYSFGRNQDLDHLLEQLCLSYPGFENKTSRLCNYHFDYN